ncbi:MAG: helix-turn-helix domain-containing protein [Tildeniella torsiva UHER 1998/13D]|jgi:hypothetical protein|nr:helix-turn-helix domain-containing protein [Tildeniella torsiva UHER 1998/13D]
MSDADWLIELKRQVKASSQAAVARELEISDSTVSQVLSGKYGAATTAIERLVRGRYMGLKLSCPAAGFELPAHLCVAYQKIPFAPGNPQRVAFMRACPGCPHNLKTSPLSEINE